MSEQIEVVVTDHRLHIRYREKDRVVIAADAEREVLDVQLDDDLDWVDEVSDRSPIRVTLRRVPTTVTAPPPREPTPARALDMLREDEVAQPATHRVRPARTIVAHHPDSIDAEERDEILTLVLESWRANPDQHKDETAEESHRIAKEVFGDDDHTSVMRVAGVRAALARGVYDHLDEVGDVRGFND